MPPSGIPAAAGPHTEALKGHLSQPLPGGDGPDAPDLATPSGRAVGHDLFYRRVFNPAVRRALPPELHGFRFHDLRHACAAFLIADGAHPLAIKTRLGHEDIRTTMNVYGHMFPSGEEALAEGLDAGYRAVDTEPAPAKVVQLGG